MIESPKAINGALNVLIIAPIAVKNLEFERIANLISFKPANATGAPVNKPIIALPICFRLKNIFFTICVKSLNMFFTSVKTADIKLPSPPRPEKNAANLVFLKKLITLSFILFIPVFMAANSSGNFIILTKSFVTVFIPPATFLIAFTYGERNP